MSLPTPPSDRRPRSGGTLRPVELGIQEYAGANVASSVVLLFEQAKKLKDERFDWYDGKRRELSRWANGARTWLAVLGGLAVLLTALSPALRLLVTPGPD